MNETPTKEQKAKEQKAYYKEMYRRLRRYKKEIMKEPTLADFVCNPRTSNRWKGEKK